ncbi:hypothetical protein KC19_2G212700 [Ceratodon purpureus]|uniref:GIL1/IRKI C-terminal domain-containing protein n=1 Tax=Ceratodon purpureus TaxID=3225 RepID=A0A8T0IZI0_CERPU|nr:hypothetical protein KC19_2G212700 [Ceratodon purpureus]
MPSLVGSGRIERLEILNFKSFKCHQIVGPFKNFAAIVDGNGGGRTDLEDAINFVLGVRSFQSPNHPEPRGRIAFVKLVFSTGSGEEIKFGRAITSSGTSEYRINNIPVTWEIYNNTMKGLDILGEIDSDASKDSKDPTLVSEPLSAPDELKKIQLELEIQKVRAEEKLISQKRKMFPAGRKQNQEQKEGTDEQLQQEMDMKAAEMDCKAKMESLSADMERSASDFEVLDQFESLREKERELEAARKAAIEAADKWKNSNQPSFRSLASPLSMLDEGDPAPEALDATKVAAHSRSKSRLKIKDIIGKEKGVGFQSTAKELHNKKIGESNRGGRAGVLLEVENKDKQSRSLPRNKSLNRENSLQRSRSHGGTRSQVLEERKDIHESRRPAETTQQPDATNSAVHTLQWFEIDDDEMYWSDVDPDKDSLGKAEELAEKLFRDAMEMHRRLSAEADMNAVSRFCSKGQNLMAETKETCGAIMYANGHSRLGEESELNLESESRPLSFSQTSECSDTPGSGLGETERAHLERMEASQRAGSTHLNKGFKENTSIDDDGFEDGEKVGGSFSAMEELSRLRGSNARKQVKIDSLQKWRAYYKSELEARVQKLEDLEKRYAKELKKKDKAVRKLEKAHGKEIAHRDAKRERMEEKLREQIKELNLVIEELSGQLYDMEEHLAVKGIPYKPSVNDSNGPSSKTLLSAVIGVKEAAHTFSRTFMSHLKQHLTKARDLDEQICLESEVIVARPSDYKFLVQSFICRRMFLDFDSECFNIESCMTEIFDIEEHTKACFQEYMMYRNVSETVTLLTDNRHHSAFLREFCFKKFLHIVSESTEEAFFGDFNHSDDICAGRHPSSRFYESYCKLAVSVWLLHRLAFSFQPPARMISVRKGAHFDPTYMESSVPGIADSDLGVADGSSLPFEALVGLMVHPGFRVGSSIIPSQVYLVTT